MAQLCFNADTRITSEQWLVNSQDKALRASSVLKIGLEKTLNLRLVERGNEDRSAWFMQFGGLGGITCIDILSFCGDHM